MIRPKPKKFSVHFVKYVYDVKLGEWNFSYHLLKYRPCPLLGTCEPVIDLYIRNLYT